MVEKPEDPGGGGGTSPNKKNTSFLPGTSRWAGDRKENAGNSDNRRSFEQILADANANRNILEIQVKRIEDENVEQPTGEKEKTRPPNLSYSQLGELLFDHLMIKQDECIRFNLNSNPKEVVLKPGSSLDDYCKTIKDFYGYNVTSRRQESNSVKRITFRNVPSSVPAEEILHLCSYYGTPINNKVSYERLKGSRFEGMVGSTMYVEVKMKPGLAFNNYYWMEGPLPDDRGARITVLHKGQPRQCSHCLRLSKDCPADAQGIACKDLKTPQKKMIDYMAELKVKMGYQSLKAIHAQKYPNLDGSNQQTTSSMEDENEEDDDIMKIPKEEYLDLQSKAMENQVVIDTLKEKLETAEKSLKTSQDLNEDTVKITKGQFKEYGDLKSEHYRRDIVKVSKEQYGEYTDLKAKMHNKEMEIEGLQKAQKEMENHIRTLNKNENNDGSINKLAEQEERIAELTCKLSDVTKELENQNFKNEQLHVSKEISKTIIMKENLDEFLAENLKDGIFEAHNKTYDFLIDQYAQILSTPEHYLVDKDSAKASLSDDLFEDIVNENDTPLYVENLESFKKDLADKLYLKFSPRKGRRNSIGTCSVRTPVSRSQSMKRKNLQDHKKKTDSKLPKLNNSGK